MKEQIMKRTGQHKYRQGFGIASRLAYTIMILGLFLFAGIAAAATPPLLPLNSTGDLFVMDNGSDSILRITPAGNVSIEVSEAQIMAVTGEVNAGLSNRGLAFDANNAMYFTDSESDTILKKIPGGPLTVLTTQAAVYAAIGETDASLQGIAFGSDGFLYVIEAEYDTVLRVDPNTGAVTVYVPNADFLTASGATYIDLQCGIVGAEGGIIYVASDEEINAIFRIVLGSPPVVSVLVSGVPFNDLDVYMTRAPNGDLIIADNSGADTIYRVTPAGVVSVFLSKAQLDAVAGQDVDLEGGIAFDSGGYFYVAEENTDSILRFSPALNGVVWISAAAMQAVTGEDVDLGGAVAFNQGGSVAVPTMTEWGILIFILFAGLGSVVYLRKARRA
jgi:streptogramin lyase